MGDPIRVLHVVVNMNRGGAETLLMNLYRNIDRSKIQFDFLTCKEGVFDQEIIEMGGKVHRIPYVTDVGHFRYLKELEQFFATQKQYRIVHSHMDKMSGIVLKAAKKSGIPVRIAHSHNTSSEGSLPARLYKWYAGRFISKNATNLVACSREAGNWLFPQQRNDVAILKNGVDSSKFSFSNDTRIRIRDDLNVKNQLVIGHVGRFNVQKNHSFLLETFSKITKKIPNTHLVLVGDGPLKKEMEDKVVTLNIEKKVTFLGIRHDVDQLLQGFDLFLFPSHHEGLPVTLIEAQASGLPCIISDAITTEVDMGMNLITSLPILESTIWLKKVEELSFKTTVRNNIQNCFKESGYDIKNTAAWTQDYYLAM